MERNLENEVAVVTGGGGVLCSVMARELAARGAKVVVMSRKQENADAAADAIREVSDDVLAIAADVLDRDSLLDANEKTREAFGPCTLLVNGAGGNHPDGNTAMEFLQQEDLTNGTRTFFDLGCEGFSFVFDTNMIGVVQATQVFARDMAATGHGSVINVSSMSAFSPLTKVAAYSAAKAAVNNFTQWLAVHLSGTGVRVNAIAPGFFLTRQNKDLLTNPDGSYTARGGKVISQTPMGRYGKPEELLGTLVWLADQTQSGFVTGVVVPVDGGFNAYSGV
ncbi:MAG TPA: D-mannonate oxidoreductase [Lentisphaeria bacterium]|nr:D-mannonate oxidoreductase [Lentisphaeria bacterium]